MQQKELLARLLEIFLQQDYIGVEIGVDRAETTVCLLEQCKKLKHLYAIDPYFKRNGRYKEISVLLKKYTKCTFIRNTSNDAINSIPKIDFVFIDGDHSYEAVKSDLNNYVPKLKSGGLLTGHDWTCVRKHFGVVQAAEEFLIEHKDWFYPLYTDENLINMGLPEFKRGGWSKKIKRHLIHKKRPSAFPLWWLIKN